MKKQFTLSLVALLLLTLSFSFLISQAQSFEEIQKLLADDGAAGDYFGYSVCISGDFAIIGASRDGDNGDKAGSAYIFKKINGSWIEQSKLLASDGSANDHFGFSVGISGDFAIVGAYGDDDSGDASGSAYIFFNNLGSWEEQAKLTSSDGTENDWFGQSVGISENYAIIGAWGNNDNGSLSGAAYIFYNNSGNWQQQIKLLPADAISSHYFGQSVSISGDFAIVGASGDGDLGVRTGAAYIYNNNSGIWIFHSKVYATEFTEESYFGHPVCINGSKVIIGAQGEGGYSGASYIFKYNLNAWEQESRLIALDGASMDFFGYSVSISGDYAIVGANRDDDNGSESGSAYIFYNNSGIWQQQEKITASDGVESDYFGNSVSISGNYAIVGAYHDDDNGSSSGSAYIFRSSQTTDNSLSFITFLEGPFNGTDMNTNLNPEPIPLSQPYNDPLKWNYQGTESVSSIPNADVVDWVLVELRETSGDASTALPDSMITQQAAFILKDGSIVGMDGTSPLLFDNEITDNLYVVVYHRNHLPVMSSGPLTAAKGDYTWDFTIPAGQAYGTDALIDLGGGVYGMIGGDTDANSFVDLDDKNMNWFPNVGKAGYFGSDLNLDSQVNNIDKNDIWEHNLGEESQLPSLSSWLCGDSLIDDRDGQSYITVQIGTQCWMAENLNIGIMINGGIYSSNNGVIEKYCYDNNTSNCDTYGSLYQWDEMMEYTSIEGIQGICPNGWHVPTDEEWKQLEGEVDSQFGYPDPEWDDLNLRGFDVGLNLKSTIGWYGGGNGVDLYGFSALPGGCLTQTAWIQLTIDCFFWSSSEINSNAWSRILNNNSIKARRNDRNRIFGYSVRCLLDEGFINQPPIQPSNPSPPNGSIDISIDTVLSWSCSDPDGDDLIYNVYFGTEIDPPLVQFNHPDTFYNPGTLLNDTSYYWKIVAYDTSGDSTVGDVWSFSSIANTNTWQEVYNPATGETWMDRNLGASQIATSSTDADAYGDLYQWGRAAEGHESRTSETTSTNANTAIPSTGNSWDGLFITETGSPFDWLTPQNTTLWQGENGTNNPCPAGFRLPTYVEFNTERQSWTTDNAAGAYDSPLKLTVSGFRYSDGTLGLTGSKGYYWTSTVNGILAVNLNFNSSEVFMGMNGRAYGISVRCIKDE